MSIVNPGSRAQNKFDPHWDLPKQNACSSCSFGDACFKTFKHVLSTLMRRHHSLEMFTLPFAGSFAVLLPSSGTGRGYIGSRIITMDGPWMDHEWTTTMWHSLTGHPKVLLFRGKAWAKSSFMVQSCPICEIVWAAVFPSGAFRVAKMHHTALQWVMFQISTKSMVKHTLIYSVYIYNYIYMYVYMPENSYSLHRFTNTNPELRDSSIFNDIFPHAHLV